MEDLVEEIDAADADRADGVAVIGLGEREELLLLGAAALPPVLERDLERDLDRGRAGVAVEDARQAGRRDLDQPLGELDRRLVGEAEQRRVGDAIELRADGVVELAAAMAVHVDPERARRRRGSGGRRCRSASCLRRAR